MADVIVGKSTKDKLTAIENKTQVYGLAGNDTLSSNGKSEVMLIGGSGNDVLQMTGGSGTLSGDKGKDTFNLNYSATKKISAVIEDIDPTNDKIVITYDGDSPAQLNYSIEGDDVIWTDDKGYFNLTLKGSTDASDYYEGSAHEFIWDVLRIVNQERETAGLSPLTLSQGLMDAASIRAEEQIVQYGHTRPDGSSCFTAVKKSYWNKGENVAGGQISPEDVMEDWMNSTGHRANILSSKFKKLGVGYTYDSNSNYKYHWVQMFGSDLTEPDTLSTEKILSASVIAKLGTLPADDSPSFDTVLAEGNTNIRRGGTYTISKNFSGKIRINTKDAVTIDATDSGNLKNVQILTYSASAALTINNLNVTNDSGSVIAFGNGTGNTLTLAGKNILKTNDTWAAVVNIGGGLTIDGTGTLNVTAGSQGPGIGYNSYDDSNANLTINGCTITATAKMGAGIGSGSNGSIGNITINGGTVKATSTWGAEVGAGYKGSAGTVTKNKNFDGEDSTKLTLTNSTKSPVTVASSVETIDASARTKAIKITGNKLANTIIGGSKNDTIHGAAGNDSLVGNEGNDILFGGSGNDTFTGGTGNDLFVHTSGKDIITDYTEDDKISLATSISKTTLSGKNVVFTTAEGKLTVKNGKGKTLNVIDLAGQKYSTVVGGTTLTLTNSATSPVTIGSAIKVIDTSKRTSAIKITGNKLANTIIGGSKNDSLYGAAGNDSILGNAGKDKLFGGKGNDTLLGGAGNDSLWGDAGADTFIYSSGDGKDVIFGFDDNDTLTFDNIEFTASYSSKTKALTFKVDGGSVTLKDFTATTFHVNNDTYQISGKNFVKN